MSGDVDPDDGVRDAVAKMRALTEAQRVAREIAVAAIRYCSLTATVRRIRNSAAPPEPLPVAVDQLAGIVAARIAPYIERVEKAGAALRHARHRHHEWHPSCDGCAAADRIIKDADAREKGGANG